MRTRISTWQEISALAFAVLWLVGPGAAASRAQTSEDPDPATFSESIEVDLVTVPFYAVDAEGDPVYDLKPEEVELRLDGKTVPLDVFDRYGAAEPVFLAPRAGTADGGQRPLSPSTPRHVFLLFDLAFSTPRGAIASEKLAGRLLAGLPETDWMYLLSYHTQHGFEQHLGPVPANEEGRKKVGEGIAAFTPNVERIRLQEDLQPIARGKMEGGGLDATYMEAHASDKAAYRAEAMALAGALESFAVFLQQIKGPKLVLYFSQGIDTQMYLQGLQDRLRPLQRDFEPVMKKLGETGAMLLFLNAEVHTEAGIEEETEFHHEADAVFVNSLARGESTLADMARVSGGKVLAHTNLETLTTRVSDWTSAYYEVGYYPPPSPGATAAPEVALAVKRPGVEVWTPRWARAKRPFSELSRREKQFVLADLVLHGPQSGAAREVTTSLYQRLEGRFAGGTEAEARKLSFEIDWPPEVRLRAIEVYSVLLDTSGSEEEAKLLALRGGPLSPGPTSTLSVVLPERGKVVWGIVAVEPVSGAIFLRRFQADLDAPAQAAAARPGG